MIAPSDPCPEDSSAFDHRASVVANTPSPHPAVVVSISPPLWSGRDTLWSLLLVSVVLFAYVPVWRAGFVWDDRAMLTANPCIVGPLGLRQLWTTHFADICPLTLSALWLEHALWGLSLAPYHVFNVLLHAADAVLFWRVLRTLRSPGAWLGAALWALHPVGVESVAWITEQKNTLSGLFFLASILCFLRWRSTRNEAGHDPAPPPPRTWPWYALTLLCAALAMAGKSSTVVLPVVLGLCVWWMEGRLRRHHVAALLPLVLLAAAASALSLWTQGMTLAHSGQAQSPRPWATRLPAAGEAVWFYLGKLVWPHPLVAVYPGWPTHVGEWLGWLSLLGVFALLVLLWRRRTTAWARAAFFAFIFFLIGLLPVLGLLDNTIFRYALVFDHFQYLASMGPLALAGAGLARLAHLTLPRRASLRWVSSAAVLSILGTLSWQRSKVYHDEETFWTDTVTKNPACWLAHGNLGSVLLLRGQVDAAQVQYEKALTLNPDDAEAHGNLGVVFLRQGRIEPAIVQEERALAIDPNDAEAHANLGNALAARGQYDPAILHYERALTLDPASRVLYFNLGNALSSKGQVDAAITRYRQALTIDPDYAEAHNNLGNAFLSKRQLGEAIDQYQKALTLNPGYAEAHNNLGVALLRTARFDEAVAQFQAALRLAPTYPNVQNNLATAQMFARRVHPSR